MTNKNLEFSFIDFRIISSNFHTKTNIEQEFDPSQFSEIEVNFAMAHNFIEESKTLRLLLKIDIGGNGTPFNLSLEGAALFAFAHPFEDMNDLRFVAEIHCAAIAFPYLREAIADITRRGGFPPLHLPPVNFVETYKRNHPEAVPAISLQ